MEQYYFIIEICNYLNRILKVHVCLILFYFGVHYFIQLNGCKLVRVSVRRTNGEGGRWVKKRTCRRVTSRLGRSGGTRVALHPVSCDLHRQYVACLPLTSSFRIDPHLTHRNNDMNKVFCSNPMSHCDYSLFWSAFAAPFFSFSAPAAAAAAAAFPPPRRFFAFLKHDKMFHFR